MTTVSELNLQLIGNPPRVLFRRGASVADDFWYALSVRMIAHQPTEVTFTIPLERFLANRRWFRYTCLEHFVGIQLDEPMRDVLRRAEQERRDLDILLSEPLEVAAHPALGGRYIRELRDFQQRDLQKLLYLPHGANFSVPGAGKTAVTYALYEAERLRGRVDQLLVVAPLSAFDAWETEALRCFADPPRIWRFNGRIAADTEVTIVNYQRLRPGYEVISEWVTTAPTHIVLDEAHRAKGGRSGEWGTACLDLAFLATRRDILTGTPAPQAPSDFLALVDFLWPNQARRVIPPDALAANPTETAMSAVNTSLGPLFVRTTKRELGLVPPRQWVELVTLSGLQSEIYQALRNRYAGMFELSRADRTLLAQMGEVTMYLLQAATNPALLARRVSGREAVDLRFPSLEIPPNSQLADLVNRYPQLEIPPKFQKLAVIVDRNANLGLKTLVWSNFPGNLLALEHLLARHEPALIYGAVPTEEVAQTSGTRTRQRELARFREDPECKVMLANPAAMAEGVSLHEVCHDAVYVERTFNAGQYLQSLDRIHRLGLLPGTETRITFLLTSLTIDEAVDERVGVKATRLGQMLNDRDLATMALPDEEDYGEAIEDLGDIAALLEHLAVG